MAKSVDELLDKGKEFEDNDEWENACSLYYEGIRLYPNNLDFLLRAAHVKELLGDKEETTNLWKRVIELNPHDVGAFSKLADMYYDTDKYQYYITRARMRCLEEKPTQTISDLKKALDLAESNKDTLDALFLLAQMYIKIEKNLLAIEELNKMLNIEDNINVFMLLSELYEQEEPEMAVEIMKRAIEKFPESKNLQERLAYLYSKDNNPENALEYAQSPNLKAKAYLQQDENEKAFEEIKKIQVKDYSYFSLLSEYYFNTKKYDECLQTIVDLEKINALNPVPYQMKALVYEERGEKFNAFYNWGKCYELQGKYEMALSEYLNAYNEDENNASAISHLVNLYEILNEKYSALEFLQKLIKLEPNNIPMAKKLADYLMKDGNEEEAVETLENCIKSGANDYVIYAKLAKIYDKAKRYQKALNAYEKYLASAPVSEEMEFVKARVDELRAMEIKDESEPEEEEGFIDKIIGFFSRK